MRRMWRRVQRLPVRKLQRSTRTAVFRPECLCNYKPISGQYICAPSGKPSASSSARSHRLKSWRHSDWAGVSLHQLFLLQPRFNILDSSAERRRVALEVQLLELSRRTAASDGCSVCIIPGLPQRRRVHRDRRMSEPVPRRGDVPVCSCRQPSRRTGIRSQIGLARGAYVVVVFDIRCTLSLPEEHAYYIVFAGGARTDGLGQRR